MFSEFMIAYAIQDASYSIVYGGYRPVYYYWANISPISLNPDTTYWLSIVNNTPTEDEDLWFWMTVGLTPQNELPAAGRYDDGYAWMSDEYELAFNLTNDVIPEPTSLLLLGTGLGVLGLAAYRRKRK